MDNEYKHYLTASDYVRTIILFFPVFILLVVVWTLVLGEVDNIVVLFALLQTPFVLYFRLIYIASIRKKQNKMIWKAKESSDNEKDDEAEKFWYEKKIILTATEKKFYYMIKKIIGEDYIIWPQINLATIIEKKGDFKYQNELYRNIDFGIFDKENLELLLLIEINDQNHNLKEIQIRDKKVRNLCDKVRYRIISFWVEKPNEEEYVKERIMGEIDKIKAAINKKDEERDTEIIDI